MFLNHQAAHTSRTHSLPFLKTLAAWPLAAVVLLATALPVEAQRGRSGHGQGKSGKVSQHHGSRHSTYSGHREARSHSKHRGHGAYGNPYGYRSYGGHRGYGPYRSYAYGGHSSYGSYRSYGGHRAYGPYRSYAYGGHSGYGSYKSYSGPYSGQRGYRHGSYIGLSAYSSLYGPYASTRYEGSIRYGDAPTYGVPGNEAPSYGSQTDGVLSQDDGSRWSLDVRQSPAIVTLVIEPLDASVYLDDEFLGLASEVPDQILIAPGSHRLAIVRPGLEDRELDMILESGEQFEIDARLSAGGIDSGSR